MQFTNNDLFSIYNIEICILEKRYKIYFHGLLQNVNNRRLESEIGFKILNNFANESLKKKVYE
jgi:hypothetical protein